MVIAGLMYLTARDNEAQVAAANGITNGVGDNRFAPDYDCTREQAITMLYRFAKLKG